VVAGVGGPHTGWRDSSTAGTILIRLLEKPREPVLDTLISAGPVHK